MSTVKNQQRRTFRFLRTYFYHQSIFDNRKTNLLFGENNSVLINESIFNLINLSDGKFSYSDVEKMTTNKRLFFLKLIVQEKEREIEELKKIRKK